MGRTLSQQEFTASSHQVGSVHVAINLDNTTDTPAELERLVLHRRFKENMLLDLNAVFRGRRPVTDNNRPGC